MNIKFVILCAYGVTINGVEEMKSRQTTQRVRDEPSKSSRYYALIRGFFLLLQIDISVKLLHFDKKKINCFL